MKYILGVIGVVVLAIIAIALLLRSPAPNNGQKPGGKPAVKLADFSSDTGSNVTWTMQGPVEGQDQRRSVRITVSPNERRLEILAGYEESVERTQTFSNNTQAYETFIQALNNAGFARERDVPLKDERGVCPLGNRFIYELRDDGDQKLRTWSASCNTAAGPFAGNALLTRQLFQRQIPDYNKQVRDVNLF